MIPFFNPEKFETTARNYIQKVYLRTGQKLPNGWDDPDVLQSLGIGIAINDQSLAAQPELRRMIYGLTPANRN